MDKYLARECKAVLKDILLHDWDPIGVSDFPEASDEYDGYLGSIFLSIKDGATEQELAIHLSEIEANQMGLSNRNADDLLPVTKKLIRAYEDCIKNDAT
jgi:hypothetical protein